MKLKHINPKSTKVIYGLFAILFILAAAHSSAIIDLRGNKSNQSAQVGIPILGNNDCISLRHQNNIIAPHYNFYGPTFYSMVNFQFSIRFRIHNNCNYPIHIIRSNSINNQSNQQFNFVYNKLEELLPNNTVSSISPQTYTQNPPEDFSEYLFCVNCFDQSYVASPISTFSLGILYYTIPANGSRDFENRVVVPSEQYPATPIMRIKLEKLRWFKPSALVDNLVTDQEVLTYFVPLQDLNNRFTTSFAQLFAQCPCEGEGLSQEEVEKIRKEMGLEGDYLLDPRVRAGQAYSFKITKDEPLTVLST